MSQISIIKYSDVRGAKRIDAEYFKPEYLKAQKKISSFPKKYKLKKIIHPNEFVRVYQDKGLQTLLAQNVRDNYLDFSNKSFVSPSLKEKILRNKLDYNNVLMTRSGANFGQTAPYKESDEIYACADILIIKSDEFLGGYLSTFLNTKYGKSLIIRGSYGLAQPHIAPSYLYMLEIPKFEQTFEEVIDEIVNQSIQKQTQSKQLYRKAEQLLLAELGLLGYQIKHSLWFTAIKNQVSESRRYDSEYFQPKYAEIIKKIEKYEGGWDFVKNAINFKDKNYIPKDNQKYKYLALSNISSQGYIQDYQEEFGKDLPSRARRKINTNDLIISSIEGSLSSCALVEKEFDNSICSTGFFVLNSEKINSEALLILFKSLVIQELLQRGSKGTILTAISKTELEQIKIPLIKPSVQKQIAEKIQESHKLRKESKELLEDAKRKVEEEIEKED